MAIDIPWMEGINHVEYFCTCAVAIAATSFVTVIGAISLKQFKTRTLFWFFSTFFLSDLLFIVELAANLLSSAFLLRIEYSIIISAWLLAQVMFFAHLVSTSVRGWIVLPILAAVAVINSIMLDPATEISKTPGSFIINRDIAAIPFFFVPLIVMAMVVSTTYKIYRESPDFVRRSTYMIFFGASINLFASAFSFMIPYVVLVAFDAFFMIVFAIVIIKHPGLFSIVTYRSQYLVLLDENDDILFDFWWHRIPMRGDRKLAGTGPGEREIKEILTNSINRFGNMFQDPLKKGLVVEFVFDHGVYLIYKDSSNHKVGLFTRSSSQALRDGIKVLMAQIEAILVKHPTEPSMFSRSMENLMKTQMLDIRTFNPPK